MVGPHTWRSSSVCASTAVRLRRACKHEWGGRRAQSGGAVLAASRALVNTQVGAEAWCFLKLLPLRDTLLLASLASLLTSASFSARLACGEWEGRGQRGQRLGAS